MGWMQQNLGTLGNRPLRHICMPGSHDAGMSTFGTHTALVSPSNTVTQTADLLGQLQAGARYFDIRPVLSGGAYYTGHYSQISVPIIGATWQGANGQSIPDIVQDVNNFTSSNQELVVLYLSHDLETDEGYIPFSQDQWNGLFSQLSNLNHLFVAPNPTSVDLTMLTLNDFIGSQPAVVVVVEPSSPGISLGGYASSGFYTTANFSVYNQYSDTDNLAAMEQDQLSKLAAQRPNPNAGYFLLSWTLTQSSSDAVAGPSILDLANTANSALPNILPACSAQTYPNIILIDNVTSGTGIANLAMEVNSRVTG
jgi:hypothetical protein